MEGEGYSSLPGGSEKEAVVEGVTTSMPDVEIEDLSQLPFWVELGDTDTAGGKRGRGDDGRGTLKKFKL